MSFNDRFAYTDLSSMTMVKPSPSIYNRKVSQANIRGKETVFLKYISVFLRITIFKNESIILNA